MDWHTRDIRSLCYLAGHMYPQCRSTYEIQDVSFGANFIKLIKMVHDIFGTTYNMKDTMTSAYTSGEFGAIITSCFYSATSDTLYPNLSFMLHPITHGAHLVWRFFLCFGFSYYFLTPPAFSISEIPLLGGGGQDGAYFRSERFLFRYVVWTS